MVAPRVVGVDADGTIITERDAIARRSGLGMDMGIAAPRVVAVVVRLVARRLRPWDRLISQIPRHLLRRHVRVSAFDERRHARDVGGRLARAEELSVVGDGYAGVRRHEVGLDSAVRGGSPAAVPRQLVRVVPRRRAHRKHPGVVAVRRVCYRPLVGVFQP